MTGRTVTIDLPLQVATDTETHVVHIVHLEYLGHAGDVTVAGLAGIGPQRLEVAHMGKVDVPRQSVNAGPLESRFGRVRAVAPERPELPDFGEVGGVGAVGAAFAADHDMAPHTGLQGR